jgi:hypothetical protein
MFNVLMGVMVGFVSAVPFLNMFGKREECVHADAME